MKTQYDEASKTITVALSKRNLLALLHKVDQDWSAATLMRAGDPLNLAGEPHVVVRAEQDDVHYSDRPYAPGPAHPATEAFIANPPDLDSYGAN